MIKLKDILNEAKDPNQAELRKVMKNIRKYKAPFTVVVIQNNKVIKQEIDIKDWRMIPAHYRELAKDYPKAEIRVEDSQGLGVINEASSKNYYTLGGDRYDGGVELEIYVNGRKVYNDWSAGDHDWKYKKKEYNHINKLLDVVAKDNGLKSHKDFKRNP